LHIFLSSGGSLRHTLFTVNTLQRGYINDQRHAPITQNRGGGDPRHLAIVTFEVFHHHRFCKFLLEEGFNRRILLTGSVQQVVDQFLLLGIQRDNANRFS